MENSNVWLILCKRYILALSPVTRCFTCIEDKSVGLGQVAQKVCLHITSAGFVCKLFIPRV
jgi:hypothetical protein